VQRHAGADFRALGSTGVIEDSSGLYATAAVTAAWKLHFGAGSGSGSGSGSSGASGTQEIDAFGMRT
jgi:hypothetical protein